MGVSHTLFRRFFWAENILWKEDVQGHHMTVALAGRDIVMDTKVILAYLTGSDDWTLKIGNWTDAEWKSDVLDVLWFQELDHGQVFDEKWTRSRLVKVVRRFCKEC